jgi:hypothetical protein
LTSGAKFTGRGGVEAATAGVEAAAGAAAAASRRGRAPGRQRRAGGGGTPQPDVCMAAGAKRALAALRAAVTAAQRAFVV